MTLGWVVNAGRRHAGQQEDFFFAGMSISPDEVVCVVSDSTSAHGCASRAGCQDPDDVRQVPGTVHDESINQTCCVWYQVRNLHTDVQTGLDAMIQTTYAKFQARESDALRAFRMRIREVEEEIKAERERADDGTQNKKYSNNTNNTW